MSDLNQIGLIQNCSNKTSRQRQYTLYNHAEQQNWEALRKAYKNSMKYAFTLLLLIGCMCSSRFAFSQIIYTQTPFEAMRHQGPSLEYHYEITEIQGKDLPHLVGMPIEKIGLFALHQNVLVPVPFQFEEHDLSGQVYFKEDAPIQGTQGIFDKEDVLLVYFKDAGTQIQNTNKHHQRLLGEIEVTRHQKSGYFYAALEPNQVFRPEVFFEPKSGTITTPLYQLFTEPSNFLVWRALIFNGHPHTPTQEKPKLEDQQVQSLLDSLKIRMKAKVLPFFIPISMSNEDIESHVAAVNHGLLRQTILIKSAVRVSDIPIAQMTMRFYIAPQDINLHTKIKIRPSISKLTVGAKATISLDGNNLLNSQMQTSLLENDTFKVDGQMSLEEKKISGLLFDKEKIHWISLETPKNFSVVAKIGLPRHSDMDIKLLYVDDKNQMDAPENIPGQTPNVGFILTNIPGSGSFDFFIHLTFVDSLKQMNIHDVAATLNQKPRIVFHRKEILQARSMGH